MINFICDLAATIIIVVSIFGLLMWVERIDKRVTAIEKQVCEERQ